MIEQFVEALPAGLLPHIGTILFVLIGLMVALAALTSLVFNRLIIAGICVAIATGLWIVTPEISDRAEIRHMLLTPHQVDAKADGVQKGALAGRLHVSFIGKGYVNIVLDGAERPMQVGEDFKGIKLLKIEEKAAIFEIEGKQVAKGKE